MVGIHSRWIFRLSAACTCRSSIHLAHRSIKSAIKTHGFAASLVLTERVRNYSDSHWRELTSSRRYSEPRLYKKGKKMAAVEEKPESAGTSSSDSDATRRPQFGNRFLENPENVFQHNAWDNVTWDPVQLEAAKKKVEDNSADMVCLDKQESYETEAGRYWDDFYSQHQNKFFKDRHWLFTEFPELSSTSDGGTNALAESEQQTIHQETPGGEPTCGNESSCVETSEGESIKVGKLGQETCGIESTSDSAEQEGAAQNIAGGISELEVGSNNVQSLSISKDVQSKDENQRTDAEVSDSFPGQGASKRVLEVGCGVGNTIFPILQTNANPGLFVYGCDFSATAIDIVRQHAEYNTNRCHAFVCDVSDPAATFPFPEGSLDVVVMIFVMSAINPDKFQSTVDKLARLLRPGGLILFRDYGRYDMAQLRFKKGRCLSENFYVRGDGTRVYFFTQEELRALFVNAGLTEEQNIIDRRLQVNRGRQLTMYRVWIQCKYRKPEVAL